MKRKDREIFYKSLIEMVNPLCLRNDDMTSRVFFSRQELYLHIMEYIHSMSTPGYVDVAFIVSEIYDTNFNDVNSILLKHFAPLGIPQILLVDTEDPKSKVHYRNFIRALHSYCDTGFDVSAFDRAFVLFMGNIESKKLEEEIKKKTNSSSN